MNSSDILAEKQTRDMEALLPSQMKALAMNKKDLSNLRTQRLRKLLDFCKKNSPWYREKLAHINPEGFTLEQLPELPILTKDILMEHWDRIVTNPELTLTKVEAHIKQMQEKNQFLYLLDRYRLLVTSGSSGRRGIFIYDWDEWNTYYLMFKRYRFYNEKRTASLLNPLIKKTIIAAIVGTNPIHSIYSLEKSYKTRSAETIHFPITSPMNEIISGLNATQPDVLLGSSSTLFRIAQEVAEGKLSIAPKVISVYGEALYPPVKEAIAKAWPGAGIFNTFGTSEGLSASYCRANSNCMHINEDLCVVEPVDTNNAFVQFNQPSSKLLLTNLFNFTLPLIRYEIRDELCFLDQACDCGSHFQLIAEPQSRPDFDFIYFNNIFVNHVVFAYPLLAESNIKEFQVLQTTQGAEIKLLAMGPVDLIQLEEILKNKLMALGIVDPQIFFTIVNQFEYPASGKLRRFIPLKNVIISRGPA